MRTGEPESRLKQWAPAVIGLALIAFVFFTGILHTHAVMDDLLSRMELTPELCRLSLENGNTLGDRIKEGTQLNLQRGHYQLILEMEADGENKASVYFYRNAVTAPDAFKLAAGRQKHTLEFDVDGNGQNLQLEVILRSGTYLELKSVSLVTPAYSDRAWWFTGAVLLFCLVWIDLNRNRRTGADLFRLACMAAAVAVASLSSIYGGARFGQDGIFHLARLENLKSALEAGQFPARVGGFSYNGFGAATSVFYPDVFLYPFAWMRMGGASPDCAFNVLLVMIHIGSCASMYLAADRMMKDQDAAACSAIFYTLTLYRISNVYNRVALGEALAMVFLPLFFCGLWEAVQGKGNGVLLGVSASCIFLSHMISSLLCALAAAIFCLFSLRKWTRNGGWRCVLKAVGLAGALCLFQIVPLMTYSLQGIGAGSLLRDVSDGVRDPGSILLMSGNTTLGILPVAYGSLALAETLKEERREQKAPAALLLKTAFVCLLLVVWKLPWQAMAKVSRGVTNYVQYPWRLIGFGAALLALAGGWGILRAVGRRYAVCLALVFALLFAWPQVKRTYESGRKLRMGENVSAALGYMEYMLPEAKISTTDDQGTYPSEGITLQGLNKAGTSVTAEIRADQDGEISFPLFAFDGYEAKADGKTLAVTKGKEGRMLVHIPAGIQGTLQIRYKGKWFWRISDALSLCTWAGVLTLVLRRKGLEQGKDGRRR